MSSRQDPGVESEFISEEVSTRSFKFQVRRREGRGFKKKLAEVRLKFSVSCFSGVLCVGENNPE